MKGIPAERLVLFWKPWISSVKETCSWCIPHSLKTEKQRDATTVFLTKEVNQMLLHEINSPEALEKISAIAGDHEHPRTKMFG